MDAKESRPLVAQETGQAETLAGQLLPAIILPAAALAVKGEL